MIAFHENRQSRRILKDVFTLIQHPLILIGCVMLVCIGAIRILPKFGILQHGLKSAATGIRGRILDFGLILAVFIVLLGLWDRWKNTKPQSNEQQQPTVPSWPFIPDTSRNIVYCSITLLLPPMLNGAEILVDEKIADVIEKSQTSITIRLPKSDTNRKITVKSEYRQCVTYIVADSNKKVEACM